MGIRRVSQDTTTHKGVEHVSTFWTFQDENGIAQQLQSRVKQLPNNHTALSA